MNTIYYSSGKLLFFTLGSTAFSWLILWAIGHSHGIKFLICFVSLVFFASAALLSFAKLFGDRVALRYDVSSVYIGGFWRSRSVAWTEVISMGIEQLDTYAYYGLIKTSSTKYIVLRLEGGWFGSKKLRLSMRLLDLPENAVQALLIDLECAWHGATTRPLGSMAQGFSHSGRNRDPFEGVPLAAGSPFDADAVMSRYLADRRTQGSEDPAATSPARREFGRRRDR